MKAKYFLSVLLLLLFLPLNPVFSGGGRISDDSLQLPKYAIANFVMGINSENEGVYRCSVCLAARYKIQQAVKPLLNRLMEENDLFNQMLILSAIYRINDPQGIKSANKFILEEFTESFLNKT